MNKRTLLIAAVFHFGTFSRKRQLKTSQVDKKTLSAPAVKVTTFQDAAN